MKKLLSKRSFIAFSLIFLLLLMWIGTNQFANASFLGSLVPSATSTPGDPVAAEVERIQKELSNPNIDKDYRKQLEEQLKFLSKQQSRLETLTVKKLPTYKNPSSEKNSKFTPSSNQGRVLTGIFKYPFLQERKDLVIENAWSDLVDGKYVTVFAGSLVNDKDQGEVCFANEGDALNCMHSPNKEGAMQIVEHKTKEGKLVLKSRKGNEFFFDIRGRKFANSIDEIIPTVTPSASDTATTPYAYP